VPVTLSGAVFSCIATEDTELDDIYQRLDEGLEQAQANGGNQIVSSTIGMEERVFSIDRALKLIQSGQTDDLAEHAAPLLQAVMPLLEFSNAELQLGLETVNQNLRDQLDSGTGSE
jgi:hypothetical protein